jgi:glycosyltransferase involved in cell wall biosynthesis
MTSSTDGHAAVDAPAAVARAGRFDRQGRPVVSVVVPTRNEAGNVEPLVDRLARVLPEYPIEVLFVDDSEDGTDDAVRRLEPREHCAVRLLHREPAARWGGLGGAVVDGMRLAQAPWVCVMDADLQHPPEVLADMIAAASGGGVDLVVASRFCAEGDASEFGRARALLSRGSTVLAQRLFARELRQVTDPMSGFFLVRRNRLDLDALKPRGFKILLEILIRARPLRITEVPFEFGTRLSGESKASPKEAARYLGQLWQLRVKDLIGRFGRFGVTGLTGLAVNTLLLALFADVLGIWYVLGAVLATQGSTLWNFTLSERWVFRGREHRMRLPARAAAFFAMNNLVLLLRIPLLFLLVTGMGMHHLVANVISLLILSLLRFGIADTYIWAGREDTTTHQYDLHGIITIVSDGRLPELERFRVDGGISDPTIRLRLERVTSRGVGGETLEDGRTRVHYAEWPGSLGFAMEVDLGERIDITASPLLRRSPHVLYTNVVEPVLRWAFVERGYALVHAACMASGEHGFLITARTDTGKTTTALKTLDNLPFSFLSDDLTLLTPDGRVLTYPKPLTISRHTLSAVRTPLLRRRERLGLIVQSRLHSRSGRLFGLIIAKTRMPAATINALVQLVIPPPKYQVDRLVPQVTIIPEARLVGLTVIQREGDEGSVQLEEQEALDLLLSNCEDAYGFPPYPTIQHWLHSRGGLDLKGREREIIESAMAGKPSHLLCSHDRDWYRMFPAVVEQATGRPIGEPSHAILRA